MVVTLALILTFSPGEKEQHSHSLVCEYLSGKSRRANFSETENDSPSGEGRDEGVRETFFNAKAPRPQDARKTGELLCVSARLVSPKSDEGGWRFGFKFVVAEA